MQILSALADVNRQKLLAVGAFGTSSILAFVLLGSAGGAAALIFAPLLAVHLVRQAPAQPLPSVQDHDQARPFAVGCLSRFLGQIGHPTVALVVEIDEYDHLEEIYGRFAMDAVAAFVQGAVETHLTEEDITVQLDGSRFVAALAPQAPHDLETMLNTCTRIQHSMTDASLITDLPTSITLSIGFAASNKLERPTGEALLHAAFSALAEARRKAPNAVRGYSKTMATKRVADQKIAKEARLGWCRGRAVTEPFSHI